MASGVCVYIWHWLLQESLEESRIYRKENAKQAEKKIQKEENMVCSTSRSVGPSDLNHKTQHQMCRKEERLKERRSRKMVKTKGMKQLKMKRVLVLVIFLVISFVAILLPVILAMIDSLETNCVTREISLATSNQDLATSVNDPKGERVLPELNQMDKGSNAVGILEGKSYKLQFPLIDAVNCSQADINKSVDIIAAQRIEREYFQNSQEDSHLASRMGSEHLGKVLSEKEEQRIFMGSSGFARVASIYRGKKIFGVVTEIDDKPALDQKKLPAQNPPYDSQHDPTKLVFLAPPDAEISTFYVLRPVRESEDF